METIKVYNSTVSLVADVRLGGTVVDGVLDGVHFEQMLIVRVAFASGDYCYTMEFLNEEGATFLYPELGNGNRDCFRIYATPTPRFSFRGLNFWPVEGELKAISAAQLWHDIQSDATRAKLATLRDSTISAKAETEITRLNERIQDKQREIEACQQELRWLRHALETVQQTK